MSYKKKNSNRNKSEIKFFKKKFIRNVKDYGIWTSVKKSTSFLIKPAYHKITYIIYEINIQDIQKTEINRNDYEFKILTIEDDCFINQIEDMEEWLGGELKEILKTNGICMAVIAKDKVAGFNLMTLGEGTIALLKLRVITGSDEAWSEQISIHKDFRRKGLANQLRSKFYNELKKMGVKALYGHRQEWNIASKMSAQKYTFKELVKADYIKILNIQRFRYAKLASGQSGEEFLSGRDSRAKVEKRYYYMEPRKKEKYLFTCDISDFKA